MSLRSGSGTTFSIGVKRSIFSREEKTMEDQRRKLQKSNQILDPHVRPAELTDEIIEGLEVIEMWQRQQAARREEELKRLEFDHD